MITGAGPGGLDRRYVNGKTEACRLGRRTIVFREGYMEIITVRDLRLRPGDIWRRLKDRRELVLTSNGRPVALMIGVAGDEDIDATLRAVRRALTQAAVSRMRVSAARSGADRLSKEAIDDEIAAARLERRR